MNQLLWLSVGAGNIWQQHRSFSCLLLVTLLRQTLKSWLMQWDSKYQVVWQHHALATRQIADLFFFYDETYMRFIINNDSDYQTATTRECTGISKSFIKPNLSVCHLGLHLTSTETKPNPDVSFATWRRVYLAPELVSCSLFWCRNDLNNADVGVFCERLV